MGEHHAARPEREISYRKLAKGPITATGTLSARTSDSLLWKSSTPDGKVVFPVEVDLTDAEGTTVAEMTVDWHVRRNQRGP